MRYGRAAMGDVETMPDGATQRLVGDCNVCGRTDVEWEWFGPTLQRARCPHCRGLDRHRHLIALLDHLQPVLAGSEVVLEYGPSEQVRNYLVRTFGAKYVGTDISTKSRRVDIVADGCKLPLRTASVDLAVCFHVLEHIPDDIAALGELRRVLGRGGIALVQSPWRRGRPTDEDPSAPPRERAERFGFKEHVRVYGEDFDARLEACGFRTTRVEAGAYLPAELRRRSAIPDASTIWVCRPASDGWTEAWTERTLDGQERRIDRLEAQLAALRGRKAVRIANRLGRVSRRLRGR